MASSNLNALVAEFFQNLEFLQMVSTGHSIYSNSQEVLVKNMFALAFAVLTVAHKEKDKEVFQRIYDSAVNEVVPSESMKQLMEYPEKYDTMVKLKNDFIRKTAAMKRDLHRKRFCFLFGGRRR